MNAPEEERARIHAERIPQPTVSLEQRPKEPAHEARLIAYSVKNLLMKEIPKARHSSERCHAALFQATRNFFAIDLIDVNNPRSDDCG